MPFSNSAFKNLNALEESGLNGAGVEGIIKTLPATLRKIDIESGKVKFASSVFENLNALEELKLMGVSAEGVIKTLPAALREISIRNGGGITFIDSAFESISALEELRLEEVSVGGVIANLPAMLRKIGFFGKNIALDRAAFGNLDTLEELNISDDINVEGGIESLPPVTLKKVRRRK
jgi:hypothetical protein